MKTIFPELPTWSFETDEMSAGVYQVTGLDAAGRRVQTTGTDPDTMLAECRQKAAQIDREVAARSR